MSTDIDWSAVGRDLDAQGFAVIPRLLDPEACARLSAAYEEDGLFRKTVVMERHGYGRGQYRYFGYPLPEPVARLRTDLYPCLAALAGRWSAALGLDERFPADLADYLRLCHEAGQTLPTPLVLRYGPGDFNCLHQDVYGAWVFPLQLVVLLSRPGEDFTGGELVLTEQRPRMQSRPMVVPLAQGDAAVIPVRHRPVQGARGVHRVAMRHGVSVVRSGRRHTLGIIFHDASS